MYIPNIDVIDANHLLIYICSLCGVFLLVRNLVGCVTSCNNYEKDNA